MFTRLILIRHGKTEWTVQKRYCGFKNIGLSKNGRDEAEKLSLKLKSVKVDKIYSSDRIRAIQTAKIIFKKRKITVIRDLKEMHFGLFEEKTYKQLIKEYPAVYQKWLSNPFRASLPEGERLSEFKKRVVTAFKKIVSHNKNKTVAVVCHGGTISVFLLYALKSKDFWGHIPKTGSIRILEYKNRKARVI